MVVSYCNTDKDIHLNISPEKQLPSAAVDQLHYNIQMQLINATFIMSIN